MGNVCACLRTGSGAFTDGTKYSNGQEITSLDHRPSISSRDNGQYKKTATSTNFQASPDTEIAKTSATGDGEPELNFSLQMPVLDENEVETFFLDAKQEAQERADPKLESTPSSGKSTHVEIFTLAHLPNEGSHGGGNDREMGSSPSLNTQRKTHVTVLSLSATDDQKQRAKVMNEDLEQAGAVHIDMSTYLTKKDDQQEHSGSKSGIDNPIFISSDNSNLPLQEQEISTSSKTHSPSGVTNLGFTSELEDIQSGYSGVELRSDALTTEDSETEELNENYFFFGMESVRFESHATDDLHNNWTSEADREIAEMISDIQTTEEKICSRLEQHKCSQSTTRLGYKTAASARDSNLFEDVLNNLKDVCVKVEDILRKKGVTAGDDGLPEDWLTLPDLKAINRKYEKKSIEVQTATVKKILETARHNEEDKVKDILADYKCKQEKLMRMRDLERRKILESLKKKLSRGGDRNEGDEEQVLQSQYRELMDKNDDSEEERGDGSSHSSASCLDSEVSQFSSFSSNEEESPPDTELTSVLKETLTQDIQARITEMTQSDFCSIMDIYRKERSSIRKSGNPECFRLQQSLWEKLEERKKHVDKSIHDGLPKIAESSTCETSATIRDKNISVHSVAAATESSCSQPPSVDASTEIELDLETFLSAGQSVAITEQDLSHLTQGVLAEGLDGFNKNAIDKQELETLLKKYFSDLNKLREAKQHQNQLHKQRLIDKLKSRDVQAKIPIEADDLEIIEQDNSNFAKEEKLLQERCMKSFGPGQTVTRQDVELSLAQYKKSQEALNERHSQQRTVLKQRLEDKLAARRTPDRQRSEQEGNESRQTSTETHPAQIERRIEAMDEEFYESLVKRKQKGEITQDELAHLIEEHLNTVEEFRKNVMRQLSRRRRERREQLSKAEISALVKQNRENREHVLRLRREERDKVEDKLMEKLKKKQARQHSDVP